MLILYDLCCTGSWASLITAQFRSQNWRGKPVFPAISSPTFYTASTSPCLFYVIFFNAQATHRFSVHSISCRNITFIPAYCKYCTLYFRHCIKNMNSRLFRISPTLIHVANISTLFSNTEGQTNQKLRYFRSFGYLNLVPWLVIQKINKIAT